MTASARARSTRFPPRPRSFRARTRELGTLEAAIGGRPSRIALIGAGGSGKSTLACALGHRIKPRFPGGIHWFRVGAWDVRTLAEMLGLRLGVPLAWPRLLGRLRDHLRARGPTFIVLDNQGYGTERLLHPGDWKFNDIPQWQFHRLPECLCGAVHGCEDSPSGDAAAGSAGAPETSYPDGGSGEP